jgi:hypothetical protein
VTDGKKIIAQIMFLSHKKSFNVKISNKKFHFSHHETNTSLIFHMWQVKIDFFHYSEANFRNFKIWAAMQILEIDNINVIYENES